VDPKPIGVWLGRSPPKRKNVDIAAKWDNHYTFDTAGFAAQRADEACVLSRLIFLRLLHLELYIAWKNGMCGLEDHDCRARMRARQGCVRSNRTTEQLNNRILIKSRNIIYAHQNKT
jgi:hypothetical protein